MTVAEVKQLALDFSGAEEEQGDLPEGWVQTTIGIVAELNPAKPPKDALPSDIPVTFVPMSAVDAESGTIVEPKEELYREARKGHTSFQEGDVVFAKITPCMENGKAAIARGLANGLGFGSTEFHVLRSTGALVPEYLFYYIRQESFRRAAEAEMTGSVGQRRVPVEFLESTPLPLPPLAEQKRIAAKIEALLARVNAARGRLERVPVLLKRFRQAVLAAACSGRLTEEQSSETWTWTTLERIAAPEPNSITDGPFGSNLKTEHYTTSGPRVIRLQNIGDGFFIDARAHISQGHFERLAKHQVLPGDVVIGALGDPLPRACIIPEIVGPAIVKADCIRFKPHPELADSRYVSYWSFN